MRSELEGVRCGEVETGEVESSWGRESQLKHEAVDAASDDAEMNTASDVASDSSGKVENNTGSEGVEWCLHD
jgi:hypothetical protein